MFSGRDVNGEDTMTPRRSHVHWRFGDHSVCVAEEEEIEGLFLGVGQMQGQVLQVDDVFGILHRGH